MRLRRRDARMNNFVGRNHSDTCSSNKRSARRFRRLRNSGARENAHRHKLITSSKGFLNILRTFFEFNKLDFQTLRLSEMYNKKVGRQRQPGRRLKTRECRNKMCTNLR